MSRQVGTWRSARLICAELFAAAAIAAAAAPAASFGLPLETPSAPVVAPPGRAPSVTVELPPTPVKAPPVTVPQPPPKVKAPTVPVSMPPSPVKAPSVTPPPVKAPTVPVQAPHIKAPGEAATAPSVTVGVPSVSATAPGVSVKASSGSAGAQPGSGRAPRVSVAIPRASGATPSARGGLAEELASTASGAPELGGALPLGPVGAPLGGYDGPGAGYGRVPAVERKPSTRARARIAARERALKAAVARGLACLGSLPERQRQLLVLRSGLGRSRPLGPGATAARLHLGAARFAQLEEQALRELDDSTARGCRQTRAAVAAVMTFRASSFGAPQARAGVEAARYEAAPSPALPRASSSEKGLLGDGLSPAANEATLTLVLLLTFALVTSAVVVDAAGSGPRHPRWRRRMRNRIRRWR